MNELSSYELFQLERYGNIIPETPDHSPVEKTWFERQCEIIEYEETVKN